VWNSRAALRHENPPIMRASGTAIPRRSWILRGPLAPQEQTSSDHPGMSEMCQQPTFDISSSFASRNHVAHAVVNCLSYSLDKRRSPPTIEDGAPRPSRRECKARTGHSRAASCSPCLRPAIWRRRTASANRPDIEHSLRRERWQHLAALFARVGVEVEEGSAGQTGLFAHPYALFSVTWRALAPGCRFAGRLIVRTSGKLANVWSPDAVNDAGGRDDCAVLVVPRRPGA
jgi:hypothetical protein